MHRHGPDCLDGPLSRGAPWWLGPAPAASSTGAAAADPSATPGPSDQHESVRTELVERIRREIAEGRYETAEKLQAALERLLDQLPGG